MLKLGFILMSICLAAALVLAATYKITEPAIQAQKANEEKFALNAVMPQADEFLYKTGDRFEYYQALKDKNIVGYILKIRASGYAGDIVLLAGIDPGGVIEAIEVLSHQETPGLGARITEPWFLGQFKGRPATGLKMSGIHPVRNSHLTSEAEISNGVQAISGATISSRAVLDAVKKEVEDFLAFLDRV